MTLHAKLHNAAARANRYRCQGRRSHQDHSTQRMPGTPPHDYWRNAERLCASYGYRLYRDPWMDANCDGQTTGPYTMGLSEPCTVRLRTGMSPAHEFSVLCHELTHMILAHAPRNYREAEQIAQTRYASMRRGGMPENVPHEQAAELAAHALCEQAGLTHALPAAADYLGHRAQLTPITNGVVRNAEKAATIIAGALL